MPKRVDIDKGWLTPEIINPLTSRCLTINIPDDLYHQVAFWGNLQNLTYENNWQGTREEKRQISEVWTEILRTARENWMSGECLLPAKFRTNPTTGAIEYQPLGGETWETIGDPCACPDPDALSPQFNPNQTDPNAAACAIATGLIEYIFTKVGDIANQLEAITDTVSAADIISVVIPPLYLVSDQVMDAAVELVEAGVLQLNAYLSIDRKEEHQEWWYCRLLDKPQPPEVSAEDVAAYKDWFQDPLSPGAGLYLQTINSFKTALWQDRARIASYGEGNCVAFECGGEWEHTWVFSEASGAPYWEAWQYDSGAMATYQSGTGWRGVVRDVGFGATEYLSIITEGVPGSKITYINVKGITPDVANSGARGVVLNGGFIPLGSDTAVEQDYVWEGEEDFLTLRVAMDTSEDEPTSLATITEITLRGTGNDPFPDAD